MDPEPEGAEAEDGSKIEDKRKEERKEGEGTEGLKFNPSVPFLQPFIVGMNLKKSINEGNAVFCRRPSLVCVLRVR